MARHNIFLDFVTSDNEAVGVVHGLLDLECEPIAGDVICLAVAQGDLHPPPGMPNVHVKGRVHYPVASPNHGVELFCEQMLFADKRSAEECMGFLERRYGLHVELY